MKKAIILGASGLVGSDLLQKLLLDPEIEKVLSIGRTLIDIKNPKFDQLQLDLFHLDQMELHESYDVLYCCIGTTAKKTPDKELYHKIDFGIPVAAAKLCKKYNINQFQVISALGAKAKSSVFYNRTKGEMEEAVLDLNLADTKIIQPSLILGDRSERRVGESIGIQLFSIFSWLFIGPLKIYKGINYKEISSAMLYLSKHSNQNIRIKSDQLIAISKLD
ncbi:MAG: nucleoside-diphosphate sugar epimerase [Flavobacteriaceae bacterium]